MDYSSKVQYTEGDKDDFIPVLVEEEDFSGLMKSGSNQIKTFDYSQKSQEQNTRNNDIKKMV